jgi:hypothetical protein
MSGWTWILAVVGALAVPGGCHGNDTSRTGPDPVGGAPRLGAHALAYFGMNGSNNSSISTPAIATQPSSSTMVVSVGRGLISAFAPPTDNKGNGPYAQLGATHAYSLWRDSGTALYALPKAAGGNGHVITASTPPGDEITLAAVEVVSGSKIQDSQWNEVLAGNPLTSRTVTTTGPAVLVAFWWGDAGVDEDKTANPDNGFEITDSILRSGALVQCAVATRTVSTAGTYDVTWTATPRQGAQLWLVAVQ